MTRRRVSAALIAGFALVAPVRKLPEAEQCRRFLDAATSRVESAVRSFESKPSEEAAKIAVALARRGRSQLEDSVAPPGCAYSRSEELIYLNHLIPGFEGWIAARAQRSPAGYEISSIIRRARTHRERGRGRLR